MQVARSNTWDWECVHICSLVPRPTLKEGKGSGGFGQKAWSSWRPAEEFARPNQIAALVQSYDSLAAGMWQGHWPLYKFELPTQPYQPIRSEFCSSAPCRCARPELAKPRKRPKVTRPFSLLWGWGLGMRLAHLQLWACISTCASTWAKGCGHV